ncbi:MAG: M28 family peptidase [Anaerolineae bacterium]|nr:M28 family peptidase [Anaerolineae bacterium]
MIALPQARSNRISLAWLVPLAPLIWVVGLMWLGLRHVNPTAAAPTSAPSTEFSSARAMEHLRVIAQEPRFLGTPGNTQARDYLVQQLTSLGLTPEVQTTTARNGRWGTSGTVHNILVRLPGMHSTGAVLLSGHYDGARGTPAAADCGACAVSLLETLRAVQAGPPLQNDVIFLFDDGEDNGLLGAIAFVREHPRAKDVRVALNLEARGSGGPVWMFQTSPGNAPLIRAYARVAPQPVTSSFLYALVKRMPAIDTNLTVFNEWDMAGLNFAFIDQPENYHTPADTLANLDERSVQHLGATALALTRSFGNTDLTTLRGADEVYFSFLGDVVHYPVAWATPLMVLLVGLFLVLLVASLRKRVGTVGGMVAGWAVWLVSSVVVGILVAGLYMALRAVRRSAMENGQGVPYGGYLYSLAFALLTVLVTIALYRLFSRRLTSISLTLGGLAWWLMLTVAATVYLPEGSYVFAWPLLCGLLAFGWTLFAADTDTAPVKAVGWLMLTFPAVPVLAPTLYVLFAFAAIAGPGFAGAAYGIVAALLALCLSLLSPIWAALLEGNSTLARPLK